MPEGDLVTKTTDSSDLIFSPKFAPTSYDKPGEVMAVASPLSDIPEVRGHRSNIRIEAEVAKGSEAVIRSIGILKGALGKELTVGEVSRLRETIIVEHPIDVIREHFVELRREMGTKGSELINAELQTIKDKGLRDFITKIAVIELTESVDLRESRWKRLKSFVNEVRRNPVKVLESLKPKRSRSLPSEKLKGKRKFNGELRNLIKGAQLFNRLTIYEYSFSKLLQENDLGVALKMAKGVSKAASILDSDIRYGKKRSKTGRQEIEILNLAGKAFRAIREIYVSRIVLEKEIADVLEPRMRQIISDISDDFARELDKKKLKIDVDLMKTYVQSLLSRETKIDWEVDNKDGSRTPYPGTYEAVRALAIDLSRNTGDDINEDFVRRVNSTVEEYFTSMHRIERVEDALSRLPRFVRPSSGLDLLTIVETLSKGSESIVKAGINATEITDKKYPADLLATINKAEKALKRIEKAQKNLVKRTSKVQEMLIKDRFQKTPGGVVTAVSRIERSSGGELFSPLPTREVVEAELGTYTREYLGSSKAIRALWGLSNKVLVRANTSVGTSLNSERFTYHLSSSSIRPLAIVGVCAMVGGLIFAHLNNERRQAEINDRIICLNAYGTTDYRYDIQASTGLQLSTVEATIKMFNEYNPWVENFRKGDLANIELSPQKVVDILVVNATPYIKKTFYPQPDDMVKGVSRAIILPLIESQKQRGEPTDKLTPRSKELYRTMMSEFAKNKNELLVKVLMAYYQNGGEFILAPSASPSTKADITKQLKARIELAMLLGNIDDQIKFTLEDMERVCKN